MNEKNDLYKAMLDRKLIEQKWLDKIKDENPSKVWDKERDKIVRKRYEDILQDGVERFYPGEVVFYSKQPNCKFIVVKECGDVYVQLSNPDEVFDITYFVDRKFLSKEQDHYDHDCKRKEQADSRTDT